MERRTTHLNTLASQSLVLLGDQLGLTQGMTIFMSQNRAMHNRIRRKARANNTQTHTWFEQQVYEMCEKIVHSKFQFPLSPHMYRKVLRPIL